jgi:hypothetical protein
VGSRTFESDKISIGGELNTSFRSRAEERCIKYKPGAEVDVYYNPKDIKTARLERTNEGGLLIYAASAVFFMLGLLIFMGVIGSHA